MKKRVHIAVPSDTAETVKKLSEKLDTTNGMVVKKAVFELAKNEKV